jgi:hypothetical protein
LGHDEQNIEGKDRKILPCLGKKISAKTVCTQGRGKSLLEKIIGCIRHLDLHEFFANLQTALACLVIIKYTFAK